MKKTEVETILESGDREQRWATSIAVIVITLAWWGAAELLYALVRNH